MIYTYKCETCEFTEDHNWAIDMKHSHPKRMLCPHCRTITMYRVFSSAIHTPFQWTKDTYDFEKRPTHLKKFR